MGVRENFQRLANRKKQELQERELQLRELRSYIQALEDSMKLLPRDSNSGAEYSLRPDTTLSKARDVLRAAGRPLAIAEILRALGKTPEKKNRVSLAGTLSSYARHGKIFTKTAPNTFGLCEFAAEPNGAISEGDDIPSDFGSMK